MAYNFPHTKKPPSISTENWSHWLWQNKNTLKKFSDYKSRFPQLDLSPTEFLKIGDHFKSRITPYYASIINPNDPHDPIARMTLPHRSELAPSSITHSDPLGERDYHKTEVLIHRYPDRVIFLTSSLCATYCRYCFRKHHTAQAYNLKTEYEKSLHYLNQNKQIKEVILSGGDPLTLSNEHLLRIIEDIRNIAHIDIIRIGTKYLAVNPFRVDDTLIATLKSLQPIYFMHHFNHPNELTFESTQALLKLADSGFAMMNQMVLLNGVNNHPSIINALNRRLLYLRVKPYYMFQCDPSEGTHSFITPLSQSLQIQEQLWGRVSGLVRPTLSIDIPGGGGKTSLSPQHLTQIQGHDYYFSGFDGVSGIYQSPEEILQPPIDKKYQEEWEALLQNTNNL